MNNTYISTAHNYAGNLAAAYTEVCPDSDAWRFGCRSIPLFVYDMLFALRLDAALVGAYGRWTWAESVS